MGPSFYTDALEGAYSSCIDGGMLRLYGDFEQAARHADELQSFAPDFIPNILRGDMLLYKMPEHNKLLIDGLREAGLKE